MSGNDSIPPQEEDNQDEIPTQEVDPGLVMLDWATAEQRQAAPASIQPRVQRPYPHSPEEEALRDALEPIEEPVNAEPEDESPVAELKRLLPIAIPVGIVVAVLYGSWWLITRFAGTSGPWWLYLIIFGVTLTVMVGFFLSMNNQRQRKQIKYPDQEVQINYLWLERWFFDKYLRALVEEEGDFLRLYLVCRCHVMVLITQCREVVELWFLAVVIAIWRHDSLLAWLILAGMSTFTVLWILFFRMLWRAECLIIGQGWYGRLRSVPPWFFWFERKPDTDQIKLYSLNNVDEGNRLGDLLGYGTIEIGSTTAPQSEGTRKQRRERVRTIRRQRRKDTRTYWYGRNSLMTRLHYMPMPLIDAETGRKLPFSWANWLGRLSWSGRKDRKKGRKLVSQIFTEAADGTNSF